MWFRTRNIRNPFQKNPILGIIHISKKDIFKKQEPISMYASHPLKPDFEDDSLFFVKQVP
jgi:hypothetical protein